MNAPSIAQNSHIDKSGERPARSAAEGGAKVNDVVQKLAGTAMKRAKQTGFMYAFKTRAYVEKNPFQAIGIAFGVGYLVKALFPGPVATLAVIGGAAYVGKKLL